MINFCFTALSLFAWCWIFYHMVMIKIHGDYIITEGNQYILITELVIVFLILLWGVLLLILQIKSPTKGDGSQ